MENNKSDFSADAPIKSAKDDLLNRAKFAVAIVHAIRGWQENESLVVGLSGDWGSGKSSIKNMVIEALKEDRLPKKETRLLVQLIKANSDFPKIVFLLLYSRKVVETFRKRLADIYT